jgi:ferrous iron transport protein B
VVLRAVVDENGSTERLVGSGRGRDLGRLLSEARSRISQEAPLPEAESAARYAWIEQALEDCVTVPRTHRTTLSDRADRILLHPVVGMVAFWGVIGVVFQAIYAWAGPMMDWIDGFFGAASELARTMIPAGVVQSLVADGIIGGVGSVMVFLPQIAILFLCLAVLEDCGYLPRGALLMERALARCGLSGKSFLPLLSCFACAVPGIMSARTIGDRRDRLATILVAPLTSCSARLPVYTMFIAAFIPGKDVLGGAIGLQGLTLFGMYAVGILAAVPVALLLRKTLLKGAPAPFILELPSYKRPDAKTVYLRIYHSVKAFVMRAGTVILAASIVMWALAYFPRSDEAIQTYQGKQQEIVQTLTGTAQEEALREAHAEMSADLLEHSFLGRMGHLLEPLVRPLGWDWRVGMAVVSSFPAREMVIASLGMIYSLGGEVDESSDSLRETMRSAVGEDGRPIFTIPVALSVMVFFALCAQCAATLSVMQRETGSWKWPTFAFGYMTFLAYAAALVTYQATTALGW